LTRAYQQSSDASFSCTFCTVSGLFEAVQQQVNAEVTFQCYTTDNGTRLTLFTTYANASFNAAEEVCYVFGANLMTITNEEQLKLFKKFKAATFLMNYGWTGVRTTINNSLFTWTDLRHGIDFR
jgi:Lectin C-type domain